MHIVGGRQGVAVARAAQRPPMSGRIGHAEREVGSARGDELATAATVAAVLFSLMVSYTRARAEALGLSCKVGIATRAVRVVILSAGLVFAKGASLGDFELLAPAVYVLAALTLFTTFQRIFHVRAQLQGSPEQGA